ncbi:MAG: PLP-dependent aminotransferase family protein [Xanthobacteraceae bacterium]|nr:PLP-dependent aminotransferase family protein [Xanthobacteraceae bacterium]
MDWVPTIIDRGGPVYQRIVEALTADIASGRLRRGQQLPTHRALAKALDVDLTTVTRAYSEARRRGLTEARVGQGTFVAESLAPGRRSIAPQPPLDLSMILPPQPMEGDLEGRLTRGIAAIQREAGFSAHLNYREPGGSNAERDIAAAWLRTRISGASGDRIVICPGTQNALFNLLMTLTSPGDTILTEAMTYPGIKAAAAYAGVRLVGVPIDKEGILPDALKAACRKHSPKAVYLIPTIHNPTTATMPPARRKEVAEVLRKQDVLLLEDDAYGALAPKSVPLASLIPERTYLAASVSKCIAPGLRVSFVLAPDRGAAGAVADALRASVQIPVFLMVALVTRWLQDGSAEAMINAIREEAAARQKLAADVLARHAYWRHPYGHHIWIPLPRNWTRSEFASHVQRQGLAIVTSETFSVGDAQPQAIRVSLGAAGSRAELVRALQILVAALESSSARSRIV